MRQSLPYGSFRHLYKVLLFIAIAIAIEKSQTNERPHSSHFDRNENYFFCFPADLVPAPNPAPDPDPLRLL